MYNVTCFFLFHRNQWWTKTVILIKALERSLAGVLRMQDKFVRKTFRTFENNPFYDAECNFAEFLLSPWKDARLEECNPRAYSRETEKSGGCQGELLPANGTFLGEGEV